MGKEPPRPYNTPRRSAPPLSIGDLHTPALCATPLKRGFTHPKTKLSFLLFYSALLSQIFYRSDSGDFPEFFPEISCVFKSCI